MLGFIDKGEGPALVLIHAFPLDHTMWDSQIAQFQKRCRVIVPDIFGFGTSPLRGPWTMDDMAAELLSLLDHLQVTQCTLLGLSIGGYISLAFAGGHPERLERLVLAHTRARADTDQEIAARNAMISALESDGVGVLPGRMIPRLLGPEPPEAARIFVRQTIERQSTEASIHAVRAMRDRKDSTHLLPQLRCPVLVITGDKDAIIKLEDCRQMAAAIPRGTLAVIPDAGHLGNLENPQAFDGELARFLEQPG